MMLKNQSTYTYTHHHHHHPGVCRSTKVFDTCNVEPINELLSKKQQQPQALS